MGLTKLPFSNKYRDLLGFNLVYYFNYPKTEDQVEKRISELKQLVVLNNDIAGVFLEPYQGDGGIVFPPKKFF